MSYVKKLAQFLTGSLLLVNGSALAAYTTSVQMVTSPPGNAPTATVSVQMIKRSTVADAMPAIAQPTIASTAQPPTTKVVGGGARSNYSGSGNLLTQTSPGAPGQNAWVGASKDHFYADPTTLTVYGIGLDDPNDDWDVGIFTQTSALDAHPVVRAGLPAGYALTGGGCTVNWNTSPSAAGNLLTASFPASLTEWECRSKDHQASSPATITAYVIGIRPKKAGIALPAVQITTATSQITNHPEADVAGVPGWIVTGGGAIALPSDPNGWGQLLTATFPTTAPGSATPVGWHAAAKDHGVASPGTVQVFAISLDFSASEPPQTISLPAQNTPLSVVVGANVPMATAVPIAPPAPSTTAEQVIPSVDAGGFTKSDGWNGLIARAVLLVDASGIVRYVDLPAGIGVCAIAESPAAVLIQFELSGHGTSNAPVRVRLDAGNNRTSTNIDASTSAALPPRRLRVSVNLANAPAAGDTVPYPVYIELHRTCR